MHSLFNSTIPRDFHYEWMLSFVKGLFSIFWDGHVIFVLDSLCVLGYTSIPWSTSVLWSTLDTFIQTTKKQSREESGEGTSSDSSSPPNRRTGDTCSLYPLQAGWAGSPVHVTGTHGQVLTETKGSYWDDAVTATLLALTERPRAVRMLQQEWSSLHPRHHNSWDAGTSWQL